MSKFLFVILAIVGCMLLMSQSKVNEPKELVLPSNKKVVNISSTYGKPSMVVYRDMRKEETPETHYLADLSGNVIIVVKEVKE